MVQNRHYPLNRSEILAALIAYTGITTGGGAADGSTLIDSSLIGWNDFIKDKTILIGSGNAIFEHSGASAFNPLTGAITVTSPFDAQILAGTLFRVLNFSASDTVITVINALIAALLFTMETGGTVTTDGTEQDVYINDAPIGVYEPLELAIDFTAQTAAETVIVRTYRRLRAGGNYILFDEKPFIAIQSPEGKSINLPPNRFGIWVTMQRIAGGAQDYDWEVFYRG